MCARVLIDHQRSPDDKQVVEIDRPERALARRERLKERSEDVAVLYGEHSCHMAL
jgi:hypothetical protein